MEALTDTALQTQYLKLNSDEFFEHQMNQGSENGNCNNQFHADDVFTLSDGHLAAGAKCQPQSFNTYNQGCSKSILYFEK